MKKVALSAAIISATLFSNASQASAEGIGLGVNYGLFSGPSIELTYPINEYVQARGGISGGMGLSETSSDTDITYNVKADGGIHRIAFDYHPFAGTFFLSAGYAVNNFELNANGTGTNVDVGNNNYANATVDATISWNNAPTLSLGWGQSPAQGFGFMIEAGAFMTGKPDVNLTATCNGGSCSNADIKAEEDKLKKDIADFDFLPMLQAGITYRF